MSDSVKKVVRLSLIIIVSAFIGILFGQLVSSYELRFMLSREYLGEYRGIEIYTAGSVNEENMKLHLQVLKEAPEQLTKCVERIYFTGTDLELPVQDSGMGKALGLTQGQTVYLSTESFGSYVALHEMFHAYDYVHGDLSENSVRFQRVYERGKNVIPIFAPNVGAYPAEFFAQAGAMCITMPFEMSIAAPEVYEYFTELLAAEETS